VKGYRKRVIKRPAREHFVLYHWSPRKRREGILRNGLCPHKPGVLTQWKPPYVCFSDSPSLAWALSAEFARKKHFWDLWMVWSNQVEPYEMISNIVTEVGTCKPTEYRIYKRVPKSKIWFVGSRYGNRKGFR